MGLERFDVGVDLVQVDDVGVFLVGDDLEALRAGFVGDRASGSLLGRSDEVVAVPRRDASALEVVGERWTLLIIRDAFYGVRRFGDFATQLGIPRAILTSRLKSLVREGVLSRDEGAAGVVEYRLTSKGIALWPALRVLMSWGDAFYSAAGTKRLLRHDADGGLIDASGQCEVCGELVEVPDIRLERGPGFDAADSDVDPVSVAINTPRRLLEPVRGVHPAGSST